MKWNFWRGYIPRYVELWLWDKYWRVIIKWDYYILRRRHHTDCSE